MNGEEDGRAAVPLETCDPSEFVKGIEPHLRRLVVAVDADVADLFDARFCAEAFALLSGRAGPADPAAMSVGDGCDAGWREQGIALLISLVGRVAATMATDRLPRRRAATAGVRDEVETVPALSFIMEAVRLSTLPQAKKEAAMGFLLDDHKMREALLPVRIVTGGKA